jgi:2,3-bisphosphoglycerate-independent phosphoglycerate mutase
MITGVDLLRGLAVLLGWQVEEVEGMTSFHDTNYAGQGVATAEALDRYDLVFSHIEAPDEASHQADYQT